MVRKDNCIVRRRNTNQLDAGILKEQLDPEVEEELVMAGPTKAQTKMQRLRGWLLAIKH